MASKLVVRQVPSFFIESEDEDEKVVMIELLIDGLLFHRDRYPVGVPLGGQFLPLAGVGSEFTVRVVPSADVRQGPNEHR